MSRCIDADALKQTIRDHDYPLRNFINSVDYGMYTDGIMQAIDEQPTIQPEVLAHGEGESTSNGIMLMIGDDGIAREYSDEFDIVIHCENKDEQNEIIKMMTEGSGPFHFIPEGGKE